MKNNPHTPRPLCDRILAAWKPRIGYHELMRLVFPCDEYPLAWRYSHNGGPPVCAMAFGKALRKLGLMRYDNHISGTPNEKMSHCEREAARGSQEKKPI